jgi:hypothetical protein
MLIVAIHAFTEKQRYNVLDGIWSFPGTRFELINDWRAGNYPQSQYVVLDANAMPPRWARAEGGVRQKETIRGSYEEMNASITHDRHTYRNGMARAEAVVEIGESLSLYFKESGASFLEPSTESFTHPVQAPRPGLVVASDHLVWKCPSRGWLRSFVRGKLEAPFVWTDQTGDARWIEAHLARCQPCFRKAADMSRSIPCPRLSDGDRFLVSEGRRPDVNFHRQEEVCLRCSLA